MRPQAAYCAGMSAYNAGRYAEAIEHLAPLAAQSGTVGLLGRFYTGRAHYRLALGLFEARDFSGAAQHFESAARFNPHGAAFERFLAACYVGSRQFDRAAAELQAALERDPADVGARVRLALVCWKQGDSAAAMSTIREGISARPDDAELHYQLGVLLASEDDLPAAERCFQRAVSLQPNHVRALERLAQCCSVAGRHQRALTYLEQAAAADPGNARIAWQLSILAQSRPAAAGRIPSAPAARLNQADLEKLGEAILAEPDFVESFLSLPASEVDCEVFSTLAATLEKALQNHPELSDLHYHCGAVYRRLGRSEQAIEHAERAVQSNPRYVKALILLAQLYGQTDRWAAGIDRLEQAIQAGGDYPDVHYLVGQLSQKAGRIGRARQAYQRALQLNGKYQAARQALAALPG